MYSNKYREYCETCNKHIILNPYDIGTLVSLTNTFHMIGMFTNSKEKYNSIVASVPHQLKRINNRVFETKLSKMFEVYGRIRINMYPTENIEKIVLKIANEHEVEVFKNGIFYNLPHDDLSLEITFSDLEYEKDRIVWIDSYLCYPDEKIQLDQIYSDFFKNL